MNKRFIEIDGINIEVTEEVYFAYKRPAWREAKRAETRKEHEVSISVMEKSGQELPSQQNSVEETVCKKLLIEVLRLEISKLSLDEQLLIYDSYFKNKTERDISKKYGISNVAVHKRKKKVITKLKNVLNKYL